MLRAKPRSASGRSHGGRSAAWQRQRTSRARRCMRRWLSARGWWRRVWGQGLARLLGAARVAVRQPSVAEAPATGAPERSLSERSFMPIRLQSSPPASALLQQNARGSESVAERSAPIPNLLSRAIDRAAYERGCLRRSCGSSHDCADRRRIRLRDDRQWRLSYYCDASGGELLRDRSRRRELVDYGAANCAEQCEPGVQIG